MALKSFTTGKITFNPCQWIDSTSQGMRWYAEVNHPTGMTWDERHSPQFRTKADCRSYAADCVKLNAAMIVD